jgi:hypothetical protein
MKVKYCWILYMLPRQRFRVDCFLIHSLYCQNQAAHIKQLLHSRIGKCQGQRRRNIDNWGGADIHIFVFCPINFFWNRLFLQSVNTNIWISDPPIIDIPAPLVKKIYKCFEKVVSTDFIASVLHIFNTFYLKLYSIHKHKYLNNKLHRLKGYKYIMRHYKMHYR